MAARSCFAFSGTYDCGCTHELFYALAMVKPVVLLVTALSR